MGKKSKAKKEKSPNNKEEKPLEIKEKNSTLFYLSSAIVSLFLLFLIFASLFILYKKVFAAPEIANYLPDNTALLFELNSDQKHLESIKTFDLLKDKESLSSDNLNQLIADSFNIPKDDMQLILGRNTGFAFLEQDDELAKISFFELSSKDYKKEFFDNLDYQYFNAKKVYKKDDQIYTYIAPYIFSSTDQKTIKEFISFYFSSSKSLLSKNLEYRKIRNNLPLTRIAFLYLDSEKVLTSQSSVNVIPQLIPDELAYQYIRFFDDSSTQGFNILVKDEHFIIQSFMNLKNPKKIDISSLEKSFKGDIFKFLTNDNLVFWSGENLAENQNLEESFLINTSTEIQDIVEILKDEYLLFINKIGDTESLNLVLKLANLKDDKELLKEKILNLAKELGGYTKKTITHTLPDSTLSREIILVPKDLNTKEQNYNDIVIYSIEIPDSTYTINYSFFDDYAAITSSIDSLKMIIDLREDPQLSIKDTDFYKNMIYPLLGSYNKIYYFNFDYILKLSDFSAFSSPLLDSISSITSISHYFNDGISSINFIEIK